MSARARTEPGRPSISPLLWCAAAVVVASRAGTEVALLSWLDGGRSTALAWGVVALVLLVVAVLRSATLRSLLLVCAVTYAIALAQAGSLVSGAAALECAGPTTTWHGTVAADPRDGSFGTTVQIRLDAAPAGPAVVVAWPKGVPLPAYGRRVALEGRLRARLREAGSSEAFRRGELLRMSPWRARVEGWASPPLGWVARWRSATLGSLMRLGGPGAESLACMLFAAPPGPSAERVIEDARTAGVAWAVTTSGLHLASVVALVSSAAGMIGFRRRGRTAATLVALGVVVLASGLRLSLLRAAIGAAVALLSRHVGRRRDTTATLGATVVLLVALDPAAAYDLGLLMGATALTAIAMFTVLVGAWLRPLVGNSASRALGASVAAQAGVGPISASVFGGIAIAGPLTLALTGPLVAGAVTVGLCGAVILPVWPPAGVAVLAFASAVARVAGAVWGVVASVPSVFLATPDVAWWGWATWLAGACGLWAWWPRPRRAARVRAGAAVVGLLLGVVLLGGAATGARVEVLDVGQGDAILVRDGPHVLLVDTGPDPVALRRALARAGVRSLDGLVLTHAHADHTGGLPGLAGVARPAWIGIPDVVDDSVDRLAIECAPRTDAIVRLRRDMAWTVGETKVRVLWPTGGERRLDANDTSVILLVEQRGGRALLLGDAEDRAQQGALDAWSGRVEMVKVAHHGSPNGNVPAALEKWAPAIALISVGEGNKFGHPSKISLETLAGIGARIERTDLEGDLIWDEVTAARVRVQASAPRLVCDNPCPERYVFRDRVPEHRTAHEWLSASCTISSPSISSTAPRSCCWSAPPAGCATGWPPSPISTSTWRRSMVARPPPMRSSTPPTRCPS